MEFKQLESFIAVVEQQSFTKAANRLYISQPTISTHIQNLEEELQSRLIIRTTKNVKITPRGQELYQCAVQMISLRDDLLKKWTSETKKILQLGASTIPSAYIIPEILPVFGRQFPDVYFNVYQSDSQGIIDDMISGRYDVGMVGQSCDHTLLTCIPFYRDRIVMITPVNDYFLNLKANSKNLKEVILNTPVILRENGSGSLKQADYFLENFGITTEQLNIAARINDQESIKNLTAGGLGISFISEKSAQNFVLEKRILAFELPEALATRSLYLLMHKDYILKPYVEEFVKFVQGYY
ncbi:MAG: selenium metabolism-associated LysR family transcriptional regulator [Brotaphodocola sp.]